MAMFRKKTVVVDARLNDGETKTILALHEWITENGGYAVALSRKRGGCPEALIIAVHGSFSSIAYCEVFVGDWVIRDENGKFFPCESDNFEQTYEPAE